MTTRQQEETRKYFDANAADWKIGAEGGRPAAVNVIKQRNDFVLDVIANRPATSALLDVGCGTGDLARAAARAATPATGIDFAERMIVQARAAAEEEGLANTRFEEASVFDFDWNPGDFDVVSANGFVEYISKPELARFLQLVHDRLPDGGSFVFSARNRLFNLVSFNSFTEAEMPDGLSGLMQEAIALNRDATIEELADVEPAPEQSEETQHDRTTGIQVSTRFQYTPLQLLRRLTDHGFKVRAFYPVHIHGLPPSVKADHPDLHVDISVRLQTLAPYARALLPFASAFMVHAVR